MRAKSLALGAIALGLAALLYGAALLAGAITLIGYDSEQTSQVGAARTRWWPIRLAVPVWLAAGEAIRAEFDVEAKFGAVTLSVAPPLILKTTLQTATAYIEGQRSGSVAFVAAAPGWYVFYADASPLGGPRCRAPGLNLREMLIGDAACPVYDVSYAVTWHREARPSPTGARLMIPRPGETLVTLRLGGKA